MSYSGIPRIALYVEHECPKAIEKGGTGSAVRRLEYVGEEMWKCEECGLYTMVKQARGDK